MYYQGKDIGLLFDVSGSMKTPFFSILQNDYNKRADQLMYVIEKICYNGNKLESEQIRIFTILFGGIKDKIYDFGNLLEISNNNLKLLITIMSNKMIEAKTDDINDIFEMAADSYASNVINEDISQRKKNGNKFRFINANDLINIKNDLESKLEPFTNEKGFNILALFGKYIYGNTPLYTALNFSFDNFKKQSNEYKEKILFIISDGNLNDVSKNIDYIGEIRKKSEENDVTIITIFLTSEPIPKEKILYDSLQNHFTKGSKDLFLMSSSLTYDHPIIKFLIQNGWDIPSSGECKLFIETNNSQGLINFIDEINKALGAINLMNNMENKKNPFSLIHLLASTEINNYVNSEKIDKFQSKAQSGGTCYANAVAAGICLASSRVLGRPELSFFKIRDILINKYGKKGANTSQVLTEILGDYRLHFKKVNEEEARKAVMKTRPCIATFNLNATQWGNFSSFYAANPKGILTKEIVEAKKEYSNSTPGGHAVVLTHISKNYLKFLNSWGTGFADNGYFKVKNANVLGNINFYDIFWDTPDLNKEEIETFNQYMITLKKGIGKEYLGL